MKSATLALAVLAMSLSGAAVPTYAATPGCMSYSEFRAVHRGDRLYQIRDALNQQGVYAGGGSGGRQYIFRECWNPGAVAEFYFSVDPEYRVSLYARDWDADLPSPHGVSVFEFGMLQEWLQIGFRPTRARVEGLLDLRGNVAEGGDIYYRIARVGEWDHRFGDQAGSYTVYVRYREGRMTRVYYLRTVD